MAKNFNNLLRKMSSSSQVRSKKKAKALLKEMALKELRESQEVTQETVAAVLNIGQASISKIEKRGTSLSIELLKKYVQALGGKIEILVKFKGKKSIPILVEDNLFNS